MKIALNKWYKIWNNRSTLTSLKNMNLLQKLIILDGFDSKLGFMLEKDWRSHIKKIAILLKIYRSNTIYEIGCGSGAFLFPFYEIGNKTGGIDYSEILIDASHIAMPLSKNNLHIGYALLTNTQKNIIL
jgi:hypothetical protein